MVEVLADEEVAVAPVNNNNGTQAKQALGQESIPVKIRKYPMSLYVDISSPQLGRVFLLALDQYFGDWLVDRVSRVRRGE